MKYSVWGSNQNRFKNWQVGDYLIFTVNKAIAALAEVSGEPYVSGESVWDHGVFPYRIGIKFTQAYLPSNRLLLSGSIREALEWSWGTNYGWGIRDQRLMDSNQAEVILEAILAKRNDLSQFVP